MPSICDSLFAVYCLSFTSPNMALAKSGLLFKKLHCFGSQLAISKMTYSQYQSMIFCIVSLQTGQKVSARLENIIQSRLGRYIPLDI